MLGVFESILGVADGCSAKTFSENSFHGFIPFLRFSGNSVIHIVLHWLLLQSISTGLCQTPKWCGIKRDKRDPTLSWGQRGRHNQMTQMPDSLLPNSICLNSQQMVAVDSLFRTYNHQRINHVVFQWVA
jgi:hypothetical protein